MLSRESCDDQEAVPVCAGEPQEQFQGEMVRVAESAEGCVNCSEKEQESRGPSCFLVEFSILRDSALSLLAGGPLLEQRFGFGEGFFFGHGLEGV